MAETELGIAVVTGASRGIGRAIAERLARDGWRVAAGFREREDLASDLARARAGILPLRIDVGDPESVREAFARVRSELGDPAALVNNAAIAQEKDFFALSEEDWERMLSVNLLGAVRCAREVLPAMRARGRGRVVNVSSIGGQWGGVNQLHYAASKAALINLTRSLARLYSREGITTNAVAPGLVATEMSAAELARTDGREKAAAIPTGRLGRPDEVAAAVAWLCSDEAAYVTGQTLNLNGGMLSFA
jgi:acetoacetyl-CoA reductase/3-oxoacyl-[acyl-carrier protein] reductase